MFHVLNIIFIRAIREKFMCTAAENKLCGCEGGGGPKIKYQD